MSTADIAIVANAAVDLAAIAAVWNWVRTGRLRLSSPTAAQLQAEGQAPAGTTVQAAELKEAA